MPNLSHTNPMRQRGSVSTNPKRKRGIVPHGSHPEAQRHREESKQPKCFPGASSFGSSVAHSPRLRVSAPLRRAQSALHPRSAFTLMELLIVIVLIGMLVGLALSALSGAAEQARAQRTRSIIAKLDALISEKWEGYRTRSVPIRIVAGTNPRTAALYRLNALRELQRLELPDRISDLCVDAELTDLNSDLVLNAVTSFDAKRAILVSTPAVARAYKRRVQRSVATTPWSTDFQGAECLYLIISCMQDGDKNALDFLTSDEVGDVDEDGMPEILDGWGRPIEFLRWAPAYTIENGVLTTQTIAFGTAPDPFDPMKIDPRWANAAVAQKPFALTPLIFSGGADKEYDIASFIGNFAYANTTPPNDPYYVPTSPAQPIGTPGDMNGNGYIEWGDNITNHYQEIQ
jgi:prepilin-type N-terminal cleavage/methylation domain-containing protein